MVELGQKNRPGYHSRPRALAAGVQQANIRYGSIKDFPRGKGDYYSSPTVVGGTLYAAREDGVVMAASIADGKLLAENSMGERVIASPVPVGDTLLIRGEKHLFAIQKP